MGSNRDSFSSGHYDHSNQWGRGGSQPSGRNIGRDQGGGKKTGCPFLIIIVLTVVSGAIALIDSGFHYLFT